MGDFIQMKQKVLFMSLFLVFSLLLSGLVATTSLSVTNQIKSAFEKNGNEESGGPARPPSGEMTVLEDKVGVDEGIPVLLLFKDKMTPFITANPGDLTKMATIFLPLIFLLLLITFFFIKHSRKKRQKSNQNRYVMAEAKKQLVTLKNKGENDVPSSTKGKKLATNIQLNETRRLLQKWEARLSVGETKKEAETINEWFGRINGPMEIIPIYEKVRYGEKSCTEDELIFIKIALKL